MALLKFLKGNYASLNNATINEGQVLICGDTGEMFVDVAAGKRVKIGDFTVISNIAALEALDATAVPTSRLYYVEDGNILARSNGTKWIQVNKQPTTQELKTLLGLGSLAYLSEVSESNLSAELAEKVNAAAEGNHAHANKAELDLIATGDVAKWNAAEQNAKDHADGLAEAIQNGETINDFAGVETEFDKVVYAEEGKSLIADTEIARLAAMSDGANKVEKSETNGNIKVDGEEVVVYTHPATHTVSEISDFDEKVKAYDYATKAEAQAMADGKDDAIAAAKKAGDDAQKTIDNYKTANDQALADEVNAREEAVKGVQDAVDAMYTNDQIDTAVQGAKDYAKDLVDAIPAQTDYTVTITENTDDATVAKTYVFSQCGAEIGSIKLAKELVVTSGSVKEVETADAPYAGAKVGEKYIELVIANQDTPIYVPAKDLVDIYTAKDGAAEVQVAISNTNEISATLVNGGITEEKLAEGVKTKLNKTWEEVGVAQGLVDDLANGQVKTNKEAIDAINNAETGILAQAKTDSSNKDAVVLAEAQKYADQAEADAIAAAEGKVSALAGNVYTKEQTFTRDEVNAAIASAVEAAQTWGEF